MAQIFVFESTRGSSYGDRKECQNNGRNPDRCRNGGVICYREKLKADKNDGGASLYYPYYCVRAAQRRNETSREIIHAGVRAVRFVTKINPRLESNALDFLPTEHTLCMQGVINAIFKPVRKTEIKGLKKVKLPRRFWRALKKATQDIEAIEGMD